MKYSNWKEAVFLGRPNRFIAHVELSGRQERVHVKNTGRLGELLLPGARVVLCASDNMQRKTQYDLIAVEKDGQLINIDSQAPNKVAAEYLRAHFEDITLLKPEYRVGDSRLDFYMEHGGKRSYIEVKGVTLLKNSTALFPDAPTLRGVKHIGELISRVECGDEGLLLFILQMKGARCLRPNDDTHPEFGAALRNAAARGVKVMAVDCIVGESSIKADAQVSVELTPK